jgi:hypothetical protein
MAAPNEIGNLYVRVGTNLSGLHTGLRTAFASVSSFARSVSSFALGNVIAGGITGAMSNMAGSITGALEAGSTLNETLSKTGVLLGKNAEQATEFAKALEAKGIGTQVDVLDSMLNSVNMLRNQGVSMQKSLELAQALEARVGDVASQDNKDPKMIRENLAAAMAGEFQVLRKYGVNASAEEQQGTGVKTAQYIIEKFMKQTQRAEGDFSRTGMGFANLQRAGDVRANAASARVGQDLQLVGQAFQFFGGRFLQSVLDISNSGAFQTLGQHLYRIVATLGIVLETAVPKVVNGLIYWAEWIANAMKPLMIVSAIFQVFQNRLTITLLSILEGLSKAAEKITFGLIKSIDTSVERANLIEKNKQIGPQLRADMEANRLRIEDLKGKLLAGGGPTGNGALDAVQNANAQNRMTSSALDSLLKGVVGVQKNTELTALQKIEENTRPKGQGVAPVTGKDTLAAAKGGSGFAVGKPAWGGFGA